MANSFREIKIQPRHWDIASERLGHFPPFKNSKRGIQGKEVGFLGEVIFEEWLSQHGIVFRDERYKTTHDYTVSNRHTVEIKTKDRTVAPQKYFDNSVPLYNHNHQRPDFYYFLSLLRDWSNTSHLITRFTHAYIVGGVDIATLEREGKQWAENEVDPSNGTKFWTGCINLRMDQLIDNYELLEFFRSSPTIANNNNV